MSIAQKAARGAAWSVVTSLLSRGLGLAGTLILMRFVVPADYGEVSAAYVLVISANTFSTVGVGLYLIANPKAGRAVTFHATVLHLLFGFTAIGGVWLLRERFGPMFDAPDLGKFVPGFALAAILERIAYVPERVLIRDLRFREISIMRTAGELTYTGVSLALGVLGWGGMSIVMGTLARALVKMVITLGLAHWREWAEPHKLDMKTLKTLTAYGLTVYAAGLANLASRRWDNLLVSRFFGPSTLGVYNLAYNLADVPAINVGEQVTDVVMASFAHLPPEKRREALVRTTGVLALVMFPLAVGLGAVAGTLTRTLLGESWKGVAPMLTLLAVLGVSRPIAGALTAYLHASNRPRDVSFIEVSGAVVLLALIATIGRASPIATCIAVGIAFTFKMLVAMFVVRRADGTPVWRFLGQLWAPLLACVPMALAVVGVRHGLGSVGLSAGWAMLGVEIVVGAAAFVGAAFVVAPGPAREVVAIVRRRAGRA